MDKLISIIEKNIKEYDKFILDEKENILFIKWEDYESENNFIKKVKKHINELNVYPRKIIYNGKEIILVV